MTRLGAPLVASLWLASCASPDAEPITTIPVESDAVVTAAAAQALGARPDLQLASVHHSLTGSHVRYQRLASDGTRVVNGEVAVHRTGPTKQMRIADPHPQALTLVGHRAIDAATAEQRARAVVMAGLLPRAPKKGPRAPLVVTPGVIEHVSVEAVALPTGQAGVVEAGYLAIARTHSPAHEWEVWVQGDGTATLKRDRIWRVDGTGFVFDPNPVMQSGNLALTDQNDATSATLDGLRFQVTLPVLDGSGNLRGLWADARQSSGRANSPTNSFLFNRADDAFEEVMSYYHITRTQLKLQALGFTNANARQQVIIANGTTDDNSFYSPGTKNITMGSGGVDDGEDADIIVHEYGHSIQDNIVPGWGASDEAGGMGEGFGDLLAASILPIDATHVPMISRACVGAWDAVSYDDRTPKCLRRVDEPKHYPEDLVGQVHADGEIWSAGAWTMAQEIDDVDIALRLTINAFFGLSAGASMTEWAQEVIDSDTALYAGAHLPAIRKALWDRGVYRVPATPGTFTGTVTQQAANLGPTGAIPVNTDERLTISQPNATAIRVHFSTFNMETDAQCLDGKCDYVYIFDGGGVLYGVLGGNLGASDGPIVPGNTVVVRWVTDGSVTSPGFRIDRYDFTTSSGPTPDGGMPDAPLPMDGPGPDGSPLDAAPTDGPVVVDASPPDAAEPTPDADETDDNSDDTSDDDNDDNNDNAASDDGDDGGGCCGAGGGDASMLIGFAALARLVRRRRR